MKRMIIWIVEVDTGSAWEFEAAFETEAAARKFARTFSSCETMVRKVEVRRGGAR